ncbi:MAG TPA: hypothetical protein DCO75_04380, partial [Fibrobacteres bacterium]|nr:hypothetical protein [Fibrobacterota bacterium]
MNALLSKTTGCASGSIPKTKAHMFCISVCKYHVVPKQVYINNFKSAKNILLHYAALGIVAKKATIFLLLQPDNHLCLINPLQFILQFSAI